MWGWHRAEKYVRMTSKLPTSSNGVYRNAVWKVFSTMSRTLTTAASLMGNVLKAWEQYADVV